MGVPKPESEYTANSNSICLSRLQHGTRGWCSLFVAVSIHEDWRSSLLALGQSRLFMMCSITNGIEGFRKRRWAAASWATTEEMLLKVAGNRWSGLLLA